MLRALQPLLWVPPDADDLSLRVDLAQLLDEVDAGHVGDAYEAARDVPQGREEFRAVMACPVDLYPLARVF